MSQPDWVKMPDRPDGLTVPEASRLEVGDTAPDLHVRVDDGTYLSMEALLANRTCAVILFYLFDFSGT